MYLSFTNRCSSRKEEAGKPLVSCAQEKKITNGRIDNALLSKGMPWTPEEHAADKGIKGNGMNGIVAGGIVCCCVWDVGLTDSNAMASF